MNQYKRFFTTILGTSLILAASMTVQAQTESPMETQTETNPETPAQTQPTRTNDSKICLTEGTPPEGTQYTVLGQVKKSKISYGLHSDLYPEMAEEARELGANAVIKVDDFVAPSWFAWAAPYLKGQAVKFDDLSILERMNCQWY